jgi:class 3 adenylate cyclase
MSALSTVVFADISGSTSLYETLGNERATAAITELTHWICDTVEAHQGRVVKKLGDGVLGVFADAACAVAATAAMLRGHQDRMSQNAQAQRMDIRVGVASGAVVNVDDDCYGEAVNVASRLCERAGPAEIWATEAAVLLAGATAEVWYRNLGVMEIRGKAEMLMLYQVEWREDEEPDSQTMQATLPGPAPGGDEVLGQIQFSWPGSVMSFTSTDGPVHVGRATQARMCINDPRVSRLHARIDWRNGGFVLTDMSSFGTWVRFGDSQTPVQLRRDACMLHGAGEIALGVPFQESSATVLHFLVSGGAAPPA